MKTTEIKLPFGLNQLGELVHITEVESGKKCNCICPSCKCFLVAAKGTRNQHHFKHATDQECKNGLESAIHLAAKKVIREQKSLTLPEYISVVSEKDSKGNLQKEEEIIVRNEKTISFMKVEEEIEMHGMKVDILAMAGNTPLIVEILYTHKVDDFKKQKIVSANISAIEIDLSDLKPENVKDVESFRACINDTKRIHWLHNAKDISVITPKLKLQLQKKIRAIELKYRNEEILKQKRMEREKEQLLQALPELNKLRTVEHIKHLSERAETHPLWKLHSINLELSWSDLPKFLNVEVPDGDWIFGCDRRVWQTAFYSAFIWLSDKKFSVKRVYDWLKGSQECDVPRSAEIVGIFGRKYSDVVPADLLENLPSPWRTLRRYFDYLRDLGMLEYAGEDWKKPGNYWFQILSKTPVRPAVSLESNYKSCLVTPTYRNLYQ